MHTVCKTDNFFFLKTIDDISKEDWNDCVGLDHPFTRYEFLYALEKSGSAVNDTGWQPFHYIKMNKDTKNVLLLIHTVSKSPNTLITFSFKKKDKIQGIRITCLITKGFLHTNYV